jgi:hypothetical protein
MFLKALLAQKDQQIELMRDQQSLLQETQVKIKRIYRAEIGCCFSLR